MIKKAAASSSVLFGLLIAACGSSGNNGVAGSGAVGNGGGGNSGGTSGSGGVSTGPCTPGAKQCNGSTPESCDASGAWQAGSPCPFACNAGACAGSCTPGAGQCKGLTPQTCDASGKWVDGTDCQFSCTNGACSGSCAPGDKKCKLDFPQTCGSDGVWQSGAKCEYGCVAGDCKEACKAGEFHCEGNEIQVCDVGPPPHWVSQSPQTKCSAASGQKCDEATGSCVTLTPIGTTTANGKYYQYATFSSADGFQTAYDVDSYENKIYVNRSGSNMDVYEVTLLDTDGDGKLEPDQHPNNPLATGPIEQRTLKLLKTYTKTGDGVPLGGGSVAELYALSDRVYSLGPSHNGGITEFMLNTGVNTPVAIPADTSVYCSQMGFGDLDGKWYCSNEGARRVYSWHAPSNSWVAEFAYPDLAGSHMDGMEVIVSPKTGEQYVFVSDMTSDFIGQYRKDPTGWVQVNLFEYADSTSSYVEGFGFGALNHFWATSGTYLYELGGGDLAQYLE